MFGRQNPEDSFDKSPWGLGLIVIDDLPETIGGGGCGREKEVFYFALLKILHSGNAF